jgi:AhpD family alkylhydroperoxidase
MSRIKQVEPKEASGERAELYKAITASLGKVPNLYQAVGASPRALKTLLGLGAGLKGGLVTAADQEAIALHVAELNSCDYCLAAHSLLGKMNGLDADEVIRVRKGFSDAPRRAALLKFVTEAVREKGHVSEATYQELLKNGYTEAHVPEILLSVVTNIYTNYFNNFNGTSVDFPAAKKI